MGEGPPVWNGARPPHRSRAARLVADQLGHSRPSMTQDVYLSRRAVDSQAADALEAGLRDVAIQSEKHGKRMAKDEGQDT